MPSNKKKITIWSINKSEVKVRILQHKFEQFSCIKRQKIYDEIFGWFVYSSALCLGMALVPIVTQSHTGLHDRPIVNSTHELAKMSSLFSSFRKCFTLQNWYQNVSCCL